MRSLLLVRYELYGRLHTLALKHCCGTWWVGVAVGGEDCGQAVTISIHRVSQWWNGSRWVSVARS